MYHANDDPDSDVVDPARLSGCALAIADGQSTPSPRSSSSTSLMRLLYPVDDIEKATMDNLVIFSVQSQCVLTKETTFDVPAMMPACSGKKCSKLCSRQTAQIFADSL